MSFRNSTKLILESLLGALFLVGCLMTPIFFNEILSFIGVK